MHQNLPWRMISCHLYVYISYMTIFNEKELYNFWNYIYIERARRMGRQCCWLGRRNNKGIWRPHKNIKRTEAKRKGATAVRAAAEENWTQFKTSTIRCKTKFLIRKDIEIKIYVRNDNFSFDDVHAQMWSFYNLMERQLKLRKIKNHCLCYELYVSCKIYRIVLCTWKHRDNIVWNVQIYVLIVNWY